MSPTRIDEESSDEEEEKDFGVLNLSKEKGSSGKLSFLQRKLLEKQMMEKLRRQKDLANTCSLLSP